MRQGSHLFPRLLLLVTGLSLAMTAWPQAPSSLASEPPPGETSAPARLLFDWKGEAESLRVTTLEGRDITAEAQPREEADRVSLAVSRDQPLILKDADITTLPLRTEERHVREAWETIRTLAP